MGQAGVRLPARRRGKKVTKPFTVREDVEKRHVTLKYEIAGFWCKDKVTVRKDKDWSQDVWGPAVVGYSLGGEDSHVFSLARIENFIAALRDAVRRARALDKKYPTGSV